MEMELYCHCKFSVFRDFLVGSNNSRGFDGDGSLAGSEKILLWKSNSRLNTKVNDVEKIRAHSVGSFNFASGPPLSMLASSIRSRDKLHG